MADTAVVEAPAPNAPAPSGIIGQPATESKPALLAGKYADQAALEKGIREADKALGFNMLPTDKPLIGEGGTYATVAEAERDYKRLDTLYAKSKQPKAEPNAPPPKATDSLKLGTEPLPEEADAPTIIAAAGLKEADLVKQWQENGKLTDDQYKAIRAKKVGWSKADIDLFASGLEAKAQVAEYRLANILTEVHKLVGGKDKWDALRAAAPSFVPPDEMPDIVSRLQSERHYKGAVRDMLAMHAAHIGAAGAVPLVSGSQAGSTAGQGPKTLQEYKDMVRRAQGGEERLWEILKTVDANALTLN